MEPDPFRDSFSQELRGELIQGFPVRRISSTEK